MGGVPGSPSPAAQIQGRAFPRTEKPLRGNRSVFPTLQAGRMSSSPGTVVPNGSVIPGSPSQGTNGFGAGRAPDGSREWARAPGHESRAWPPSLKAFKGLNPIDSQENRSIQAGALPFLLSRHGLGCGRVAQGANLSPELVGGVGIIFPLFSLWNKIERDF